MGPIVAFCTSFNYNRFDGGLMYPIEGSFVNHYNDDATVVTFDNSFRKQSKGDVSWNEIMNRNFTGLEDRYNGLYSLNFYRGLLMRAYHDLREQLVLREGDEVYVACRSFMDEKYLKETRLPILNLQTRRCPPFPSIVQSFGCPNDDDPHQKEHDADLSYNCCRFVAKTYSNYLKKNPLKN